MQPPPTEDKLFPDINPENDVTEIESLCMNCHEQGTTRLLLTRVPFFRDIVVSSFSCDHCGYRNTGVQSAGSIEEKGVKYELKVTSSQDLNRQIVKAATAALTIPELQLEIPNVTQSGSLNTIEGFIIQTADALQGTQLERAKVDPDDAIKVAEFIAKAREYAEGKHLPFTVILEDIAGNSFIQNPHAPKEDPNLKVFHFHRTREQDESLGITPPPEVAPDEVMQLPTVCQMCDRPGYMKSIMTNIPHFKECLLMAFCCDHCGYKNNEVKVGGSISEKGTKITLKVTSAEDMSRDVLKSDTASVNIPEIDLELTPGTLGSKFTTVEGLLQDIKNAFEKLPFATGDSADKTDKDNFQKLIDSLRSLTAGTVPFTLIFTDPVANSYIQNLFAPDPDPNLTMEEYTRTEEEEDSLGITELKRQELQDKLEAEQSAS